MPTAILILGLASLALAAPLLWWILRGRRRDRSLASLDCGSFDVIILPGGLKGAEALTADRRVRLAVRDQLDQGRHVAAICAAPALVLGKACGVLHGRRYTCFPGMEREVPAGGHYTGEAATVDGRLITGAGPACAQTFALTIVAELADQAAADKLATSLLVNLARQG